MSQPPSAHAPASASDIPQWRWTNKQCRGWIVKVLVQYAEKDRELAEVLAENFIEFGPSVHLTRPEWWRYHMREQGNNIHALLIELQSEKGQFRRE